MSLRLVYGRAGSGKSFFCLDDMKNRLDSGSDSALILVVPEQYSLQAEKNLIRKVKARGIMRAEVLSFRRMAYRVFSEVGGLTRPHINSSGKCMLILRVTQSLKDKLEMLSKAVSQKGFVNTLLKTISEFKRYNITPGLLKDICEDIKEGSLLKTKLGEISLIYDEFENRLHQRYRDSDDDLSELSEKLEKSTQFDGAEIWIDEFSGFTPQEYKVIERLLIKAVRVNISLCMDCLPEMKEIDNVEVFSPARITASKLLDIAGKNGICVEEAISLNSETFYRFVNSKELAHLEGHFFSFPYKEYLIETKDISIFSAVNIYSEVEDTARDIIRLCRENKMRYRDIAVVSRNLDTYEKLAGAIFSEYGIPYFIDRKRDISRHPLITLILSALEIFVDSWSYEAVFRYLKTGLTNVGYEDIDLIENYVLACGIRGSSWTRDETWELKMSSGFDAGEMSEYERNYLDRVNGIRDRVVKPLADFRLKTSGRRKAVETCTALYEFLCDIGVPEKIECCIEKFKQNGELDLANEYGQVWNIVMEVFNQAVEAMGDENTSIEKLRIVLEIGFGEYKIGLIPPALDQVMIGSVERSKSHEISALYILGVNDGVFPPASVDEGILSDKDREHLQTLGMELAESSRTKAFKEQYLIYTALTTAGKYLRLSYPIADHEGKTLRPSIIISRLKRIFPKMLERSNISIMETDEANMELVCAQGPTFNYLVSALRKYVDGCSLSPLWRDAYGWYMGDMGWKERCENALSGLSYSNQTEYIDSSRARKLYGSNVQTSVSRLESFNQCPFSYYVQYGLKAMERRIYSLTPPDIGTFMHMVIDMFSKQLDSLNMSWQSVEKEWCEKEVSKLVDDLLGNMPGTIFNSSERYKYLSLRLKRVLTRAIGLIAVHIGRSGFEPMEYEVDFGEGKRLPPITVELPSGEKINLTGRIDRIDKMEANEGTYLRIVDYKSGSKAFKLSDVYYGLQIQLLAYLDAIWENENIRMKKPVLPGGVLYFKIDDPIVRCDSSATEEEIEMEITKQLKMKGLLLADVRVIREMDRQMDGDSLIIPARINKGEVLGRSSAATIEQFEQLCRYVKRLLVRIGDEILKGNVSINPYKKRGLSSCTYCSYSSICQFDPRLKDNKYRILLDIKDDDVWGLLEKEQQTADAMEV